MTVLVETNFFPLTFPHEDFPVKESLYNLSSKNLKN